MKYFLVTDDNQNDDYVGNIDEAIQAFSSRARNLVLDGDRIKKLHIEKLINPRTPTLKDLMNEIELLREQVADFIKSTKVKE